MNHNPVVDFIVIGAMKAGSTTLVDYLIQNNQLCLSIPKEPQYFSRHYKEWPLSFYESLWEFPEKICGEASTCYSRWPHYKNVPERIYNYNHDIKIIYILRNPIDRAYSHYRHNVLVDGLNFSSFNDALNCSDEIIMSSCYMLQIKQFLNFFPREQLLLIDFDEMIKNELRTINTIEKFLNVKVSSKETLTKTYSNRAGIAATKSTARKNIDRIRNISIIRIFVDLIFSKKLRQKIRISIDDYLNNSSLIKRVARKKVAQLDPLQDEHVEKISKLIEKDISELEIFWGRELSDWKFSKQISKDTI